MLARRCADAHRTYSNYNTWVQASFVAAWLPHTDKALAISSGAVKINETSAEDFVLTISWVKSLRFIWHLCKNVCKGESQCCPTVIVYSCYLWSVLLSFLRSCYHGSITYKKKKKSFGRYTASWIWPCKHSVMRTDSHPIKYSGRIFLKPCQVVHHSSHCLECWTQSYILPSIHAESSASLRWSSNSELASMHLQTGSSTKAFQ